MARRPIRVLHVVFSLDPGGMENGIVNVANALDPAEFDIHVCCLERAGAFVERLSVKENVHVIGKKAGFSSATVFQLAKLIKKLQPDILHSHNLGPLIYSSLSSVFGMLCPIIQGEHSLLTEEECSPRRLRQRRVFYRACREIHTVSNQLRDQLRALNFPQNKISVLLNGVDTARFLPGDRRASIAQIGLKNLKETDRILGIVGRFGAFKRHAILIDAFSQIANDFPDLHLLIVGDGGPERDRVRAQVQASPAQERIHCTGYQRDVRPFYQAIDILVAPSVNEGLSNAVLEAMACGLPVLAHSVCGSSEMISHGQDGWVADLETPEKLVAQLENVLAVPVESAKMKQMARTKVLNSFSISAMVDQYAALYRRNASNH